MALSHKYKGEYEEAMALLKRIYDYKDAESIYKECEMLMDGASIEKKYRTAVEYMDKSAFKNAINLLDDLGDYKDSVDRVFDCDKEVIYIEANKHMKKYWNFNEIVIGQKMFKTIKKYKDSGKLAKKCNLYKIIIVMVLSLSVMGIGALTAYFVL